MKNQIALLGCSIALFITNLDITIVNVAIPKIATNYNISLIPAKSLLIYFLVAYAIAIPLVEYFISILGVKKVYIYACIIFAISSILCSYSNSFIEILIYRIIQGLSAGFFAPISRSIVVQISNSKTLSNNLSNTQTLAMLSQALGPLIGGYITNYLGWKYIFLINLPFCIFILVLIGYTDNKAFKNTNNKFKLDFIGYILLSFAIVSILYTADIISNNLKDILITRIIYLTLISMRIRDKQLLKIHQIRTI